MSKNYFFTLGGFNQKKFNNNSLQRHAIQMGATRGMGSTTRKYNWCRRNTSNPELCINEFINVENLPSQEENAFYLSGIFGESFFLELYNSDKSLYDTLYPENFSEITRNLIYIYSYLLKYDSDGNIKWKIKIGIGFPQNLTIYQSINFNVKKKWLYVVGFIYLKKADFYVREQVTIRFHDTNNNITNLLMNINHRQYESNACYLTKYDSFGNLIWATYIACLENLDEAGLISIIDTKTTPDNSINSVYSILFNGIINVYEANNANLVKQISSNTYDDGNYEFDNLIIKYDVNGKYLWHTQIGNVYQFNLRYTQPNQYRPRTSIICDSKDNVIVSGYWGNTNYTGVLNIYNSNNLTTPVLTLNKSGTSDSYVVKYNNLGIVQWATKIGGTGSEVDTNVFVDYFDNIYVALSYSSQTLNIYNFNDFITPALILEKPNSNFGTCLIKYNKNGIAQWASNVYGNASSSIYFNNVSVNSNNEIILSGVTTSTTINIYNPNSVNPDKQVTFKNTATNRNNSYIIKFNSSGICLWASYIGFSTFILGSVVIYSLTIDSNNNICVAGFNSSSNVYAYSSTNYITPSIDLPIIQPVGETTSFNTFIIKYDNDGNPIWASQTTPNSRNASITSG
jgi:hypothetical protein